MTDTTSDTPETHASDTATVDAGSDGYSKEYVDTLKKQLQDANLERAAQATTIGSLETREREHMMTLVPQAKQGLMEMMEDEQEGRNKAMMTKLDGWFGGCGTREKVQEQLPLVHVMHCASAHIIENRKRKSELGGIQADVKKTHEELDVERSAHEDTRKQLKEAKELNSDNYKQLQVLQQQITDAGLVTKKFDFSLEKNRMMPDTGGASTEQKAFDPLASLTSFIQSSGSGSRTLMPDASTHKILGGASEGAGGFTIPV